MKSFKLLGTGLILSLATSFVVSAKEVGIKDFEYYSDVKVENNFTVSKTYEVDIPDFNNSENNYAIWNVAGERFQEVQLVTKSVEKPLLYRLGSDENFKNVKDSKGNIVNILLSSDLSLNQKEKETVLEINFDRPVKTSSISFNVSDNAKYPKLIKIVDKNKIILNSTGVYGSRIEFAETSSDYFKIIITHTDPLRLQDIKLSYNYNDDFYDKRLRFLVVPGEDYKIYFNPQYPYTNRFVNNLFDDNSVLIPNNEIFNIANTEFVKDKQVDDFDKDGVVDLKDNCVYDYNSDQIDANENGKGDACDDFDYDAIPNTKDNCINTPNYDQKDADRDGMGDVCDVNGESRWLENNKWIQWAALGVLLVTIITIFSLALRKSKKLM